MRGFGADPLVETADAITLDGGDIGTSFLLANATMHPNRGITITSNGGGFSMGGGSMNIPGPLTGSGSLRIFNSLGAATGGTLVLSHANNVNTFSGAITQSAGTLRLDSSLSPGSSNGGTGLSSSTDGSSRGSLPSRIGQARVPTSATTTASATARYMAPVSK